MDNKSSTISVGSQSMVVVPQTKIAFIGYLLILIAMLLSYIKSPSVKGLVTMIFYALLFILGLYVINCTVVGKCNLYAWIAGYVVAVIGIIIILGVVLGMIKN